MSYTCADYRIEMLLLGLRRRLASEELDRDDRKALEAQIRQIEVHLGIEEP
jgi:hypothetical protein